ncbi:Aste57867_16301 [Aphanomyces stellatus]|uniref:Aste57867_16301 protein n=1 Tax=Aphanomyces stellatus TaxID=120398 RepID=A0A485L8D3_9STRA|nr:hypothetical protein As57867_016244 [Aphanomyces stellatus]VFT93077.1 Aste57867_16301 [Aphanomyces stellatus]
MPDTDGEHDLSEVLAAVDTVLARRRYQREKQRQHRRKTKDERALLFDELAALQARLPVLSAAESITSDGMLSWRVIADVFRAASGHSKGQKYRLVEETSKSMAAIFEIHRFLNACRPMMPCPSPSSADLVAGNHSFVKLLASAESRSWAKQWLTQQLYHNTDRAFASFPLACGTDDIIQWDARFNDSVHHGTEMYQAVLNAPLKAVVAMKRRKLHWKYPPLEQMDVEVDGNTTLYRNLNEKKHYWNLLEGHFYEADRCIVVFRRVQDDETYSSAGCYEHHVMQWLEMRQITPNQTLVRLVGVRMVMAPYCDYVSDFLELSQPRASAMSASSTGTTAIDLDISRKFRADVQEMQEVSLQLALS